MAVRSVDYRWKKVKTAAPDETGQWSPPRLPSLRDRSSLADPKKQFSTQFRMVTKLMIKTVLPCFALARTLRKEFEKNKLGNIRLRAVPIEI